MIWAMEISQEALARLYLYALFLGCALGAVYDLLRISRVFFGIHYSQRAIKRLTCVRLPLLEARTERKKKRTLGAVIFFEDLFFCIFCAIALILLFYECNNGKIRYPVFLAAGVGFLMYRGTLGKAVMLFSEVIVFAVETAFRYIFFFLFFPVRFACKNLRAVVRKLAMHVGRIRKKRSRRRYTELESQRNEKNACGLIFEALPKDNSIKRGKKIVKKQKAVQSDSPVAHPARHADHSIGRRIRVQRYAVQRFDGRKGGA